MALNYFLKVALLGATLSITATAPALAQQQRVFGPGQPTSIDQLPEGRFRSALEGLPPQARGRALGLLQQGNVPVEDLAHLHVNAQGRLFFVDPHFDFDLAESETETPSTPSEITETDAFLLHSKPGTTNILYLDFDGHNVQNSIWNTNSGKAVHPMRPYSRDADYYNFSQTELDIIADSWRQVAEDFAPFDIDVTTEEPAYFGTNVGHILITQKQDADGDYIYNCSCGGVAYLNVWGNPYGFPGLVFNTSLRGVAEAASHEFGHNLSLYHDGVTGGSSYYSGHGSGDVGWAPIMGVGYYESVTQWSKGEYLNANNQEDDLAEIAARLAYQTDDNEDINLASATPLVIANDIDVNSLGRVSDPNWVTLENKGIIEDRNDIDLFSMNVGAGTIDLTVTPAHHETYPGGNRGSNLDIEVALLDQGGAVLQTGNPDLDTVASINYFVATPGAYYLKIAGVGRGDPLGDGYTDYASLSQYHIHGTVPAPAVSTNPPAPPDKLTAAVRAEVNIDLIWIDPASTSETNEFGYRVKRSVDDGPFSVIATLPANSEAYSDNNLVNGDYRYQLELFNSAGTSQSNITDPITISVPTVAVATSEGTALGSIVSGSYIDTQTTAGSETLSEQHSGGRPSRRTSYLDHSWFITGVVPGATVELYLSAAAPTNSENDDFIFTYSVNGGQSQSLGTLVNGETRTFKVFLDPATTGTVEVNVIDSDQTTTGAKNTDTVTVNEIRITSAGDPAEQAPVVTIQSPTDGTTVPSGTELVFEAAADDHEDGDISADISWNSDIDGFLGTGANLSATLSGGAPAVTHIVRASVTDSAGNTAEESVTVHVDDTPQATTMSVLDLDGAGVLAGKGGKWQAAVTVTVRDNLGNPVSGAAVTGDWSNGANGSSSCTTASDSGSCTVSKGGLKNNVSSVTFAMTGISGTLTYDPAGNEDSDGDSDGTTITVTKP